MTITHQAVMRPELPSWQHWWPVLLGPMLVVVIYLYDPNAEKMLFSRQWQDNTILPYALTLAAFGAAVFRALAGRNPLMALVAAMALVIFYRELHWAFSSEIAYAMLVTVCLIGWRWYDKVGPFLCRGRIAHWLIMTAALYVFAVGVAKGWFQHIVPNDDVLRTGYEETSENLAHTALLFTVLFTGYCKKTSPEP
ncbi:hypothetical protein HED60_06780 [Planctomycetales bacterium ZRK34]|nr:hypothetical protein HED60_06780 [Planctomycetales bacterium ZRK34]